jgi:hypothetical protein
MPNTTSTQPAARRSFAFTDPLYGGWQNQPTGEVPSYQYRDDERYTPPPANYIQSGGVHLSPQQVAQQVSSYNAIHNPPPPPAPPPPPKPGYETGHTALVGTPIPGTQTPLGATTDDGLAATETTTAGMQSMIRDTLLNLLGTPSPTAQDPAIANASSAYNAAQNRSSARLINQNAEAFGASGLESSGARLAADRGVIEQQGLNEGMFSSGLVLNELTQRRAQMMSALQAATAINDQDLSRRLQQELADLNAAIQREGIANQLTLGQADIDMRNRLGTGNLNLGLLGLAQNGRQFNDTMGFNIAQLESTLNNGALVNLLFGS